MPARPDPPTEADDALVRDAELRALRRLAKLTESENERVALRAADVLLRYARERRREAEPPRAKTEPKLPTEGEKRPLPRGLVEPPRPAPAFRAVPLSSSGARVGDPGAIRMG